MGKIVNFRNLERGSRNRTAVWIIFLEIFCLIGVYGQGIKISGGSGIYISGNPYIIIRDGGLNVAGSYSKGSEELIFNGIIPDSIQGNGLHFHNVTVSNTDGIKTQCDTLTANNLTISAGSSFIIDAGKFVTVSGNLTNLEGVTGLYLKSGPEGSASLINDNSGILANVEHYITGGKWHIVSSTSPGQTISGFLANNFAIPAGPGFRAMTYYDESIGKWAPYLTNASPGNMEAGEGYLVRTSRDTVLYFEGGLNGPGISDFQLTNLTRGWHSIGNPFSSSMKISESADPVHNFLNINSSQLDPEYVAIYVWDEQPGYSSKNRNDFVALNLLSETAYIKPGHGFLVKSVSGGGLIDFTSEMRAHHNSLEFTKKSAKISGIPRFSLIASDEENEAVTRFVLTDNATMGLDPGYDAGLYGALSHFNLYSLMEDAGFGSFMIQAFPGNTKSRLCIPLGFECSETSLVTFRLECQNLDEDLKIILEDREKGIFTRLSDVNARYSAEVTGGSSGSGRFFLNFAATESVGDSPFNEAGFFLYSFDKQIIIKGEIAWEAGYFLYDLMGREVKRGILEPGYEQIIPVYDLDEGLFIIRIMEENREITQKLYIH